MRGHVNRQQDLFICQDIGERVPRTHPLRAIKELADRLLQDMRQDLANAYADGGRPSVPPEQLLKALLLQALYSIPSERRLMEAIAFNLLYRWFLDLQWSDPVWVPETFSTNRDRLDRSGLLRKFFDRVVAEAAGRGLVSSDHFSVDGTLIRSVASHKSLQPVVKEADAPTRTDDDPGNPSVNYRGQKRRNDTHRSTTDPEARLARKSAGQAAHLSHCGHVLIENRNGLLLDMRVSAATGTAEREQALVMLDHVRRRHGVTPQTLGADSGYDAGSFLLALENRSITPHVAIRQRTIRAQTPEADARRRARRRMTLAGYAKSQRRRKCSEEVHGWSKTVGGLHRSRFIGTAKTGLYALVVGAAYNLLRLVRLLPSQG